jgi:hypothetical protein
MCIIRIVITAIDYDFSRISVCLEVSCVLSRLAASGGLKD